MRLTKIISHRAHREHRGEILCALCVLCGRIEKTDCTDKNGNQFCLVVIYPATFDDKDAEIRTIQKQIQEALK